MRPRHSLGFYLFSAVLVALFCLPASARDEEIPPGPTEKEVRLGDKVAEDLEKNPKFKLLNTSKKENQALLDKLTVMTTALGKASVRPDIQYVVKIVDDKDVNAFTLPNGKIYVYKGLIDFASSDDELAGVLSHEIGHNARMHALRGDAKAGKLSWAGLAAMAAMLAGGTTGANVAAFAPYLLTGIMNGYTVGFEKEADTAAIKQMEKTKYNPSALVTFMNRLAYQENRRPEIQLGIYRTHPPSPERATAALSTIKAAGLTYNPRDVEGTTQAIVVEEKDRVLVKFEDDVLFTLAPEDGSKERAEIAAARVNEMLRANLKLHELTTSGDANSARLLARGAHIVSITAADARLLGVTPLAAAQTFRTSFYKLFWRESVNGVM